MKSILSRQNIKFKEWQSLLIARGIKKLRRGLVAGPKIVSECGREPNARELLITAKMQIPMLQKNTLIYELNSELFRELDIFGTKAPLLIVDLPPLPAWESSPPEGLELVVALSDPGNLGAVLRSAVAFGVSRVVLCQECSSPYLPRAIRTSSGACFKIPLYRGPSIQEIQPTNSFTLELFGESVANFNWPKNLTLILGEEGQGIPKNLKSHALTIPIDSTSESLNAMVAASIALFSYRSRWPLT